MKKHTFRFLAVFITFTVGLVWTQVLNNSFFFEMSVQMETALAIIQQPKTLYETSPNGKIEVVFRNYGKYENRPTLIFEIINRNSKAAKYWNEVERSNWSYVKFNGKEKKVSLCGTGMREFELPPGESFTVQVFPDTLFYEYLNKKGSIQIGYLFGFKENKYETFWSEPLMISDSLRDEIIKNASKYYRY